MSGDLKPSNYKHVFIWLAVALIALAIFGRWLPHPPNFAPIAAVALFSGVYLPKKMAVVVPLLAIVLSDLFLGLHSTIFWTWGSFALIGFLSSTWLRNRVTSLNVVGASLTASILFYTISNFGVWLQGGLYPLTGAGLMQSYINGLPFIRGTLMGDLIYSCLIFGLYALAVKAITLLGAKKPTHPSA